MKYCVAQYVLKNGLQNHSNMYSKIRGNRHVLPERGYIPKPPFLHRRGLST